MAATHPAIRWPAGLTPGEAHVHTVNTLEAAVPPEAIWPWLVRATRWHEHYANCKRLRIDGGAAELSPGARFRWWTFGVPVTTVVEDWAPGERLAWSGTGLGARGYHAWILEPTAGGCRFITEETQRGAAVWLGRPLLRRGLLVQHQRWLEGLARAAALGHPDEVPPARRATERV
jgi:hypothetical protein